MGGRSDITSCCIFMLLLLSNHVFIIDGCWQEMITLETDSSEETLTSLYFPSNYPSNLDCNYNIVAPNGRRVRIYFTSFTMEDPNEYATCLYDYITIHDGDSDADPLIGTFCGQTVPPVITSRGRHLVIHFVSDGSIEEAGFSLVAQSVSADYREPLPTSSSEFCVSVLEETTGEFFSPGYPDSYAHNQDCFFIVIVSDEAETIHLRFTSFDLEPSQTCIYDFVEVRDGSYLVSPLIGRYCGGFNNAPPSLVESSGPSIYIQFHTDISASFQGFYAEYAIGSIGFRTSSDTGESVQTSVCDIRHAVLTERSGFIVSHRNFPQGSYDHHSSCAVQIVGSRSYEKVLIDFIQVDLPSSSNCGSSSSDYIRVNDGQLDSDHATLGTLCGSDVGRYTSSDMFASLVFQTDGAANDGYLGFKALYTIFYEDAYGCADNDYHCKNDHCIGSSLVCDGYNHCGDNSDEDDGCGSEDDLTWLMIVGIIFGCMALIGIGLCTACCCLNNTARRPTTTRAPSTNGTALSTISSQNNDVQNPTYLPGPITSSAPSSYTHQAPSPYPQPASSLPPKYSEIWNNPVDVPPIQGSQNGYPVPPAPEPSNIYKREDEEDYAVPDQLENTPKSLDAPVLPPPAFQYAPPTADNPSGVNGGVHVNEGLSSAQGIRQPRGGTLPPLKGIKGRPAEEQ
ncbi:tolloid-like protein 2 [Asterias amurensis]|uniref:tolloid-like protein 2 n=1 Tax=Asterias amurensis TaxID=7602 RepID=UPI003AB70B4E